MQCYNIFCTWTNFILYRHVSEQYLILMYVYLVNSNTDKSHLIYIRIAVVLESRAFPDISLSPQRGSFSSDCKYKNNRESINKDGSGDAPATPLSSQIQEEGSKFSFHDDNSINTERVQSISYSTWTTVKFTIQLTA